MSVWVPLFFVASTLFLVSMFLWSSSPDHYARWPLGPSILLNFSICVALGATYFPWYWLAVAFAFLAAIIGLVGFVWLMIYNRYEWPRFMLSKYQKSVRDKRLEEGAGKIESSE